MSKVLMPKRLPKKNYLLGLETLILGLDHNRKAVAPLVSCLLNSSPNLKNLVITVVLATSFATQGFGSSR
ncbi:hypothetical protein ACP4OV_009241 [Aristida adscensionis]